MSAGDQLTGWQRWVQQPQNIAFRRAIFQVHLWSGAVFGLYVVMMSVTGSVLIYSNELYTAATPEPLIAQGSGPRLSDEELAGAAKRVYPGYRVAKIGRAQNPDQAVDIWLDRGADRKQRLFDARSGRDLGDSVPTGIRLVSKLIDLHDNLFGGAAGRKVNAAGGVVLLALAMTGLTIWWPGKKRWRRSLTVHRGSGWKGLNWHLHSMIGFWSLGFLLLFGISGAYLGDPEPFQNLVDRLDPPTAASLGSRVGDQVIYWLAFLHFGRINGIGIPCNGPGVCDQTTKAIWAIFGLAPAVMFVTGAIMWWNRVLRPKLVARSG